MIKGIAGSGISAFSLREEALEEEVAELQREHAGLQAASEAAKLALEKKLRDRENENEKQVLLKSQNVFNHSSSRIVVEKCIFCTENLLL